MRREEQERELRSDFELGSLCIFYFTTILQGKCTSAQLTIKQTESVKDEQILPKVKQLKSSGAGFIVHLSG